MTKTIVDSFLGKVQLIKLKLNLRQITLETTSGLSSVGRLPIPIDPPLLQEQREGGVSSAAVAETAAAVAQRQ
jgi:hypothetical protein